MKRDWLITLNCRLCGGENTPMDARQRCIDGGWFPDSPFEWADFLDYDKDETAFKLRCGALNLCCECWRHISLIIRNKCIKEGRINSRLYEDEESPTQECYEITPYDLPAAMSEQFFGKRLRLVATMPPH